jgi:vacuolar iron transporter family protein
LFFIIFYHLVHSHHRFRQFVDSFSGKELFMETHKEEHFTASEVVRDIVIGMSDGLTVPFAIAAGMTGAAVASKIVVTAGLAEIVAGSISMGLGGYLAGRTDAEHYTAELAREYRETETVPYREVQEVADIMEKFGVPKDKISPVVGAITSDKRKWVDFMMRFELGLEKPDPRRAFSSAFTIALSYAFSGLIPLAPYVLMYSISSALYVSAAVTLTALFLFGYFKGRITGLSAIRSGGQTILVGGLAAGAAFFLARLI